MNYLSYDDYWKCDEVVAAEEAAEAVEFEDEGDDK